MTVGEVAKVSSRIVDDTEAPSVRPQAPVPPGHSYIDMRHLTTRQRKRLRGELRIAAANRGRVQPDETGLLDLRVGTIEAKTPGADDERRDG